MGRSSRNDRAQLSAIAHRAMIDRGMEPDFSPAVQRELAAIPGPAGPGDGAHDLRGLPWASIDNDDSRDLDQLTGVAESLPQGRVRIRVADVSFIFYYPNRRLIQITVFVYLIRFYAF